MLHFRERRGPRRHMELRITANVATRSFHDSLSPLCVKFGMTVSGRLPPVDCARQATLRQVVIRLAMPVKSCANPGQLCWQRVVSSLATRMISSK
jgi:hypothetical protein